MISSFKLLKELMLTLSKREIRSLKKKVAFSDSNENYDIRNTKSKQLIALLIENPQLTASAVESKLYYNGNMTAFSKLIDRVIEKIDEVYLSFNKEIDFKDSERNYYFFSLKRRLLVLQMRWLRGISDDLGIQFERIISISLKYELYEILLEALIVKQRFVGFRHGKQTMEKIDKDIIKYESYRRLNQKARALFTKMAAIFERSDSKYQYKDELEFAIVELQNNFEITGSLTIKYFLLYMQVERLYIHDKYIEVKEVLEELYDLVINNKAVYTEGRHFEIIVNLANVEIKKGNFRDAANMLINAQKQFQNKQSILKTALETEYYCRIYLNEFDQAEKLVEKLYLSSRQVNVPFHFSKRAYLFACVKTIKGEIERSNELILQANELDKNKGEWNFSKRVLTIINCIESGEYEKADLKVMNLDKFVKRNLKLKHFRKREKLIVRILINLLNEGFDFDMVYKNRKKYFDLLESDDPDYCWRIKSAELVVFTNWFKKKMKDSGRAGAM